MGLRVAGNTDTEVPVGTGERDQFIGVGEAAGRRLEAGLAAGRVAPQTHHVLNPPDLKFLENGPQLGLRMSDAGQVSHTDKSEFILKAAHQINRIFAGRTARPVRHRNKARSERFQLAGPDKQLLNIGRIFGRKKLKGKRLVSGLEEASNFHAAQR